MSAATPRASTPDDHSGLPAEARAVQGQRAGPVSRGLANLVDSALVILFLVVGGASVLVALAAAGREQDFSPLALLGFSGSTAWVYLTVSWATVGSTYGQGLLGLRVVSRHGSRLRPLRAAARAGLCVLAPYLWFWILISPRRLTPFDMAVGSRVIYHWKHGGR